MDELLHKCRFVSFENAHRKKMLFSEKEKIQFHCLTVFITREQCIFVLWLSVLSRYCFFAVSFLFKDKHKNNIFSLFQCTIADSFNLVCVSVKTQSRKCSLSKCRINFLYGERNVVLLRACKLNILLLQTKNLGICIAPKPSPNRRCEENVLPEQRRRMCFLGNTADNQP